MNTLPAVDHCRFRQRKMLRSYVTRTQRAVVWRIPSNLQSKSRNKAFNSSALSPLRFVGSLNVLSAKYTSNPSLSYLFAARLLLR